MIKIIYFGADWCAPCKRMKPILEEFSEEHSDIFVVKVDVDEDPDYPSEFNVVSVPTTVVMNDNKEVTRKQGAMTKEALKKLVYGDDNE